jgi:hypothetical protein
VAAKRGAKGLRKYHDDALKLQKDADLRQKQIEHQKKCKNAKEQYIQYWNYIDMYHNSDRCWKDAETAWDVYNQLKSESARRKIIKEQLAVRKDGFRWDDAGHAWSKNGRDYTSQELMKHFIEVVLPMEALHGAPEEPPIKFQGSSEKIIGDNLGSCH